MANEETRRSRRIALRAAGEGALIALLAGAAWGVLFALVFNRRAGGTWVETLAVGVPAAITLAGGILMGRAPLGCVGAMFAFPALWLLSALVEVSARRLVLIPPHGVTFATFGEMLSVSLLIPALPIAVLALAAAGVRRRFP
ncbi:MAG: hypothetical protein JNK35_10165 [Phycisphaerae bacterium]|nr:hypothetical protein [Phycisphaerae bacterium]